MAKGCEQGELCEIRGRVHDVGGSVQAESYWLELRVSDNSSPTFSAAVSDQSCVAPLQPPSGLTVAILDIVIL